MPTILRTEAYRFYFYSRENNEPPHIHVERDDAVAKYWLDPVELASSARFRASELSKLRVLVIEYREQLLRAWNDYFDLGG